MLDSKAHVPNHCHMYVSPSVVSLWDPMDCGLPGSSVHGMLTGELLGKPNHYHSRGHPLASLQSNRLPPPFLLYFSFVPQEPLGSLLKLGRSHLHFQHTHSWELNVPWGRHQRTLHQPTVSGGTVPTPWRLWHPLREQLSSHTSPGSMSVESAA